MVYLFLYLMRRTAHRIFQRRPPEALADKEAISEHVVDDEDELDLMDTDEVADYSEAKDVV